VGIDGTQYADSQVKRFIRVVEGNTEALELTSIDARQLGAALLAAAHEVETMHTYDGLITVTDCRRLPPA
jgi:hypothetical protein